MAGRQSPDGRTPGFFRCVLLAGGKPTQKSWPTIQKSRKSSDTAPEPAERLIEHMAFHDSLTDPPNRRFFSDRIRKIQTAATGNRGMVTGILDLDGFKGINDRLGHHAGDDLLLGVSERLKRLPAPPNLLARFGGDESGILLPEVANEERAARLRERVREDLSRTCDIDGEQILNSGSMERKFAPANRQN